MKGRLPKPIPSNGEKSISIQNPQGQRVVNRLKEIGIFLKWGKECASIHNILEWGSNKWGDITKIITLANGFFLIEFSSSEEKWDFLTKCPYLMNRVGIYTKGWCPNFNPWKHQISEQQTWIHLYNLTMDYWVRETLANMGNSFESFVTTKMKEDDFLGSYARICINMKANGNISKEIEI
ncbi:hypothetical protein SUGI_0142220 [Cryptomeria japonica]|nr:hypothetical protein SUGI_0142220 [Cryptomeria japonica]